MPINRSFTASYWSAIISRPFGSILYHFWNIARYLSKNANFSCPLPFHLHDQLERLRFFSKILIQTTRVPGAKLFNSQLSPVDRISALLTVSSSWCPGRVQSRSDHVLSAPLALCRGTLFLSASEILAWHSLLSGSSWRHSCLTFDIVLVGRCTRLCDYLVNYAFEMSVYYYYYFADTDLQR